MQIELIQYTSTKGIEEAMKTSRRRDHIDDIPQKLFSWGHWSVLEHSSMTVKIRGISRACSHQLVRQRIGVTFTQESQRYFDPLNDPDWYIMPPKIAQDPELKQIFTKAREEEAAEYRAYRDKGIDKEDARFCLSNACKTILTWTFNMSSLIWFLEQRLQRGAQWEIRTLAQKLYDLVMSLPEWAEYLEHWKPKSRR
ncbi:MAG: FAD-dependent thymidylate synthase [Candidatus Thorarchaeota archaeon]